jgi:predicted nucleic acid-binding protein
MNVLIDVNIPLDVLLDRQPWVADSKGVWDANHRKEIVGFLVATGLTNLFYIARRLVGHQRARQGVRDCLSSFDVITVNHQMLRDADALPGSDFEDNVAISCAVSSGMQAIVTRDPAGFAHSPIPVLTPAQLLAQLAQQRATPNP